MRGDDVLHLQERLTRLGYWLRAADGTYGDLTRQAVLAMQKVAGLERDGIFGSQTARVLDMGLRPKARSSQGTIIEVDKTRQLLLVVSAGTVKWALNTSTGSGATYITDGGTERAVTPSGKFAVYREVDGREISPLGVLWRPKYFNGGIAIHGYDDVPPFPASHGCVRVSDAAIDFFWSTGIGRVGSPV